MDSLLSFLIALLLAPFFPTLILKVKAFFAGKKGPPWLINYHTLGKLLRKDAVYSQSTTFVFQLGPLVSLSSAVMVLLFFPLPGAPPLLSFQGDVLFLFYLLGLGRFCTILAALDTASPFAAMGAAREAYYSALAEATVFMVLALFYRLNGGLSFAAYFAGPRAINLWSPVGSLLLLVVVALFMILLVENSRVPVDDPATHLELTMIHEAMILDHGGVDLACIEFGAYCKLLFYAAFIARLLAPFQFAHPGLNGLLFYGVLALIYGAVGVMGSITARFRLDLVPKFILTSFALVFFAAILTMDIVK